MENQENKKTGVGGEGDAMGYIVVLDDSKCPACGKCIPSCPKAIFKMVDKKIIIVNYGKDCDGCSECIDACNYNAIAVQYPQGK